MMLLKLLVIIYGAALLVGIFLIILKRNTVLVRVRTLFRFHLLFLIFLFTAQIIHREILSSHILLLTIFTTLLFILRNVWVLFHCNEDEVAKTIEGSLQMILFPFQKSGRDYRLNHSNGEAAIYIKPIFNGFAIVTLENKNGLKKVEVLKALLVKKFSKIFPRFTIHI